jgi:hypothetical protein
MNIPNPIAFQRGLSGNLVGLYDSSPENETQATSPPTPTRLFASGLMS